MDELLKGLAGAVGVPLLLFLWQALLTRERTILWGRRCGALLSRFLGQRLGLRSGGTLAERLRSTAEDFTAGLREGLTEGQAGAADAPH